MRYRFARDNLDKLGLLVIFKGSVFFFRFADTRLDFEAVSFENIKDAKTMPLSLVVLKTFLEAWGYKKTFQRMLFSSAKQISTNKEGIHLLGLPIC